jgi:hypothetical protein
VIEATQQRQAEAFNTIEENRRREEENRRREEDNRRRDEENRRRDEEDGDNKKN